MLAFERWCTSEARPDPIAGDVYFGFVTDRYPMINAGLGLALGAGTAVALVLCLALTSRNEPWLRTPRHRLTFLGIGFAAIVLFWAAAMLSLAVDQQRYLFPWCADSIAIPMFSLTLLTLVATPICVGIGLRITRSFSALPVELLGWNKNTPRRSLIVTAIFALAMLVITSFLLLSLTESTSFATPAVVLALYILEASRSAVLASG